MGKDTVGKRKVGKKLWGTMQVRKSVCEEVVLWGIVLVGKSDMGKQTMD